MFPIVKEMSRATGMNYKVPYARLWMFRLRVFFVMLTFASSQAGLFMIMIASSADFNTPFGYQTNLMVQKPGGYHFADYPKLGFVISLIGLFLCPAMAMAVYAPGQCFVGITNCTSANATIVL
jgi:Na+/H+ antiporter NhaD/arsenite permease-like protein